MNEQKEREKTKKVLDAIKKAKDEARKTEQSKTVFDRAKEQEQGSGSSVRRHGISGPSGQQR